MRGYYRSGYHVGQQAQGPTMSEMLAQLHALDAQIQQTDREVAAQRWNAAQASFVNQYWRPFVTYWDRGMKEVYEYEAGTRHPGTPPLIAALTAVTRMRTQYHDLLRYAVMGLGMSVSIPSWLASP